MIVKPHLTRIKQPESVARAEGQGQKKDKGTSCMQYNDIILKKKERKNKENTAIYILGNIPHLECVCVSLYIKGSRAMN